MLDVRLVDFVGSSLNFADLGRFLVDLGRSWQILSISLIGGQRGHVLQCWVRMANMEAGTKIEAKGG